MDGVSTSAMPSVLNGSRYSSIQRRGFKMFKQDPLNLRYGKRMHVRTVAGRHKCLGHRDIQM
jgi:hypothetical protein